MIDLYTWTTPNGRKVSILLEELGVPFTVKPVDIGKDEQFAPDFLKIAPNNRIPAIVDHETGVHMSESGAIMLYLADKYGRFRAEGQEYWRMVEWLMWQMGGLGPICGQVHHFVKYNPGKSAYAEDRFGTEARRLYRVLNDRLTGRDYVAGDGAGIYTVADMAIWPWISRHEWQQIDLADYPALRDWYRGIAERPAVQRGYHLPHFTADIPTG
ncbi:glutathione S-transferase N-terminal domain-containing protein [Paracoccus sp. 1_MG-2023]|uniref:glutathione S-transferase family protein n=1 Tax=unclassified Paracoccus (in: a-proteobacteria) TaxID=2688777 RepID=UPI001C0991DF|nr:MULTISPECIES: glutathione S-transferase N-terminal domain-containing protein [unclassified Paracoccus (in: a-proteobacteria)]MBU2957855.1 glutathione S-transferase N-terminal domain-containing protein [Paracoccus sp. C2R09]MDO6667297.1 glutathione S-transferase N-terminal domain-containing protein [Paracoccus sp. 1_MG-2023]